MGPYPALRFQDISLAYHRGSHKRDELVDIARKVRRDIEELATLERVDPYLLSRIDSLVRDAESWLRTPLHLPFEEQSFVQRLFDQGVVGPFVDLSHEVHAWEQSILDLLPIVTGLGNFCFVRLKKSRRANNRAEGQHVVADYKPLKRRNVLLNNIEMLLGRTALLSYPFQMEIDPTNDCNLKCRSCQHSILEDFYRADLRLDYMERMRDALPFVDYLHLYGNGEPFLSTSLAPMAEIGKQHQCTVDVLTNGTRLVRVDFDWTRISRLGISFDGASEEAARLLRPPSRVPVILEGIRKVRGEAPHLVIYAKVTISRVNLDELAAVVQCLGEAGVNEVILHSLRSYHPGQVPLQVRIADRPFAMEQLKKAESTAAKLGVKLVSTITFDDFALPEGCPRDRRELLVYLQNLPLPAQRVPGLEEVAARLRVLEFSYYPAKLIQAAGSAGWLYARQNGCSAPAPTPIRPVLSEVDTLIRTLAQQARTRSAPKIPYCFMPWKLPFVDPDGRTRVCDFLTDFVGDMEDCTEFAEVWNSPAYQNIRRAMFDTAQLSKICRDCVSDCRGAFAADTLAMADLLSVNVRENPNFPTPANLSAVLHTWRCRVHREIELCGGARLEERSGLRRFILPPDSQLVVRFSNPRAVANIYYRGKFRFSHARVLVGIKDWGKADLWNYWLDPEELALLGEWVSLPMPPLPIDFRAPDLRDCCLFLWADSRNTTEAEVLVSEFEGLAVVSNQLDLDDLQIRHIWSAPSNK